ncbi:MAG: protease [Gammaproteobacteria bacterium]|nr:MAG: protease [Gammaproteobacteria bacterium]
MKKHSILFLLLTASLSTAHAQLIPGVVNQVNKITRDVDAIAEQTRRQAERDLERVRLDKLIETSATLTDPIRNLPQQLPIVNNQGQTVFIDVTVENGWRAVQREWLVTLDDKDLNALQNLPIDIIEKNHFDELDITIIRFRVTPELDSLRELRKKLPAGVNLTLDRNHIYAAQSDGGTTVSPSTLQSKSACDDPVKIGMIDTAIKIDHPAFKSDTKKIISKDFLEEKLSEPDAHGTAVAGLLIGASETLTPLLPKASLYAASVFYARNDYAQGASMMNLVRALNWLLTENVSVINMSLAGPDNQILAKVISKTISNGKMIVAAAGNEGPAAPPMFPAAYPGVIAVTAVDRNHKIYRWANRGKQISFAALGVSVPTVRSTGGIGRESGTSMAAPVVSAFLSCELQKNINTKDAIQNLAARAIDLGDKGKDEVFGYGLLK